MACEILSVKLCQLDERMGKLHSRIHMSETAHHSQLRQEITALEQECAVSELALQQELQLSRSTYVTVLAKSYEEMEQVVEAIPSRFIREKALELLDTLGLSETEEAVETSARETLIELGYQVADTVIDTVVRSLLYTLSYLVCFLLGNLILRLLAKLLNVTFKLPGLHGLNFFGGGVLGLAEGWLLTTLALWLLMAFSDFMTEALIQETFLARFLFSHSFFSSL